MYRRLILGILLLLPALATAQPATLAVGSAMPIENHTVYHADGTETTVASLLGTQGTVFIFWSNTCTWTEGYEQRVAKLHADAAAQEVTLILVNSNDAEAFPGESREASAAKRYRVPYVHDPGAILARALGAYRTPEVFAFSSDRTLSYTGAIDDAPSDAREAQENYIVGFLEGRAVAATKAFGCRIRFPGS